MKNSANECSIYETHTAMAVAVAAAAEAERQMVMNEGHVVSCETSLSPLIETLTS
jgi:hypothetical protein